VKIKLKLPLTAVIEKLKLGYCVNYGEKEEGSKGAKEFHAARFCRLAPGYWV